MDVKSPNQNTGTDTAGVIGGVLWVHHLEGQRGHIIKFMRTINEAYIKLVPSYLGNDTLELHLTCVVNGNRVVRITRLEADYMESYFDRIFDIGKKELRDAILKPIPT